LAGLDLVFDDTHKYYEAPFQVKATGGILLIDDFGRQQVRPRDLLNRWIVPLENRVDFLTLHTGRKMEVPFDVLVVFSTNLPPKDLVDEAFLRRLRHKIEIGDPILRGIPRNLPTRGPGQKSQIQ
jgi:predicted ATPase with chaperone activity